MRIISFILLFALKSVQAQSFFDRAEGFFSEIVNEGRVDYKRIQQNPSKLDDLVREIAEMSFSNRRVTPEYVKAFYINAYNLLVIKQVIDHYPIEGPLTVKGFFDGHTHTIMGKEMTLNAFEKEKIFMEFPDPRLHFVLVCAAKGCPPLVDYAYRPENLNEKLTARTTEVLNLDWFIRVNNTSVRISQIFRWYASDFVRASGGIKEYINQYRVKSITDDQSIDYYDYDWSLNDL